MSAIFNKLKELPPQAEPSPSLNLVSGGAAPEPPHKDKPSKRRVITLTIFIAVALGFFGWQQYRRASRNALALSTATGDKRAEAAMLIQQKRWDEALVLFEVLAKENPNDHAVLVNMALAFKGRKEFEKAEENLGKALELQPGSAVAHNNLGLIYAATGRYQKAVESLERATVLNAQYNDPLMNLAAVHERAGRLEQAVQYYKEYAKRLSPDSEIRKSLVVRLRKLRALSAYAKNKEAP
jgi:tetratricopeptide (TPR) repeat protein